MGAPGRWRRPALFAAVSAMLVLPCYWQPRIQAGDLSSHIYNSWLAQLIEAGQAEGLVLAPQATNVLFDLVLGGLFQLCGAAAAQRIAVSLAVLVFAWGAFAFLSAVSRRRPWSLMPAIAMLAYGWVLHMGFFNFYLSLGLCLWAMAAVWAGGRRRFAAIALLALACTAHALPVAWCGFLMAYLWAARRIAPRFRPALTAAAVASLAALHFLLTARYASRWSFRQVSMVTGADQLWVFGAKYYLAVAGMLLLWGVLAIQLVHLRGARRTVLGIPFQLCVLSAAIVAALPTAILLPGFQHALVYIAERMSLAVGVCLCAMLASVRPKPWQQAAMAGVAAVFFAFLHADERALNGFEDRMQAAVAGLPAGVRVVSALHDPSSRANALAHVIDRVCIGRCFSYANYEPSTGQFRVRAAAPNRLVASSYADSYALQVGTYVPRQADLPLFQLDADREGNFVIRSLKAGNTCGSTAMNVFPRWMRSTPAEPRLFSGRWPEPGRVSPR